MLDPEKVLKSFFDANGRLSEIPVKRSKRDIVMDRLVTDAAGAQRLLEDGAA